MTAFRILSLDGGGTWALLQVMGLRAIYGDVTGHQVLRQFDLATANSGGSIVLAGLMLDLPLTRILDLFCDPAQRLAVFHAKYSGIGRLLWNIPFLPRYRTPQKLVGLRQIMGPGGDQPLDAVPLPPGPSGQPVRCQIVSFDYDRLRAVFLRSYVVPGLKPKSDAWLSLAQAVHGSTNAPVQYFDGPALVGTDGRLWDGAMGGYNNPLLAGLTDAVALGHAPRDLAILSLGTGHVMRLPRAPGQEAVPPALIDPHLPESILRDVQQTSTAVLQEPPDAASFTAHVLTAPDPAALGPLVRVNPFLIPRADGTLPQGISLADFTALKALDLDATADADVDLILRLGQAWLDGAVRNQPIRLRSNLAGEPGDPTFAEARDRWRALA